MAVTTIVGARIDEHLKEEAAMVLAAADLTVSDAFHMLLTRIAREKALPFELVMPDDTTIAVRKEACRGKMKSFAAASDLMADLPVDQ